MVVLDEVSQVATSDAEIILEAVAASPGASLWCFGDPHQAQAVRAGELAREPAHLAARATSASPITSAGIPAAT